MNADLRREVFRRLAATPPHKLSSSPLWRKIEATVCPIAEGIAEETGLGMHVATIISCAVYFGLQWELVMYPANEVEKEAARAIELRENGRIRTITGPKAVAVL